MVCILFDFTVKCKIMQIEIMHNTLSEVKLYDEYNNYKNRKRYYQDLSIRKASNIFYYYLNIIIVFLLFR